MHSGTEVSPHFDSLLVKLTCRGRDWAQAVTRARRALAEFRVRGVSTNIPFLQAVVEDPDFAAGGVSTDFIETHPQLLTARRSADRGTRLLTYLAEVTVNRPHGPRPRGLIDPAHQAARRRPDRGPAPDGTRQLLAELGPGRVRPLAARSSADLKVTDTTFRDAHQSVLATRVRTRDLVAVGPAVARLTPNLLSLEVWGGATYDVALRFLAEDPWERLAVLRDAVPNIALQMLLRGRNTVGLHAVPAGRHRRLRGRGGQHRRSTSSGSSTRSTTSARCGRRSTRSATPAPRSPRWRSATPATCPTPAEKLYTLDYYLRLAEQIVAGRRARAGDQGHGRSAARAGRATAGHARCGERFDLPAAPAHPRHRRRPAGHLPGRLRRPGSTRSTRRARRWPAPPRSRRCRRWSRRPTSPTGRPGLSLRAVEDLEPYWEAVRALYAPFESGPAVADRPGLPARDPRRAAVQPPPAGHRARPRRPSSRTSRRMYEAADAMLGHLVKVTPVVQGGRRPGAAPGRCRGSTRPTSRPTPAGSTSPIRWSGSCPVNSATRRGGWPEPFRSKALGRPDVHPAGGRELTAQDADGAGRGPATDAEPAAVPRAGQGVPHLPAAVRRPVGAAHRRLPVRDAARRRAHRSSCSPASSSTSAWRRPASPTSGACAPS